MGWYGRCFTCCMLRGPLALRLALVALLGLLAGCAERAVAPRIVEAHGRPEMYAQRSAAARASNVERATSAGRSERRGADALLLVSRELASVCLRRQLQVPTTVIKGREEDPLGLLARCLTKGRLRRARVMVRGDAREQITMREVLAKLGVDHERVELLEREAARSEGVRGGGGGIGEPPRVGLALSPYGFGRPGAVSIPVDRRRVAAVMLEHELDLEAE